MQQAEQRRKATAVETVINAVKTGIKDGQYVPGQRLVEADLTKSLNVSRGPLREAMWRLSGEGLVEIKPNYGVSIKRLSKEEALGIFAIREMLEGLAARLAAENINLPGNLKRLERALKLTIQRQNSPNLSEYSDANDIFHDTIIEIAGNSQLNSLIEQLRIPLYHLQFRHLLAGMTRASVKQHKEIVAAISSGNPDKAEKSMRKHLRSSAALLRKTDY